MSRDLTQREFDRACARRGFVPTFLGYYELPDTGRVHVCSFNAGSRRRDRLAYLIRQHERLAAAHVPES